jgi:subtilisin family serine protease
MNRTIVHALLCLASTALFVPPHEALASQPTAATFGTALLPDDPQVSSQWHVSRIRLPQAWDLTQGSPEVVIAIVDSGVDPSHPDLAGKLLAGYNTADKNTRTADQYGHGTKMAGVAAARSNNGQGIAGVASLSPIMPLRVTDRAGRATSTAIAEGIVWAVDHGARVVNLSLEGVVRNAAIRTASEYAFRHGALVVAPSGNCGCFDPSPETPYILSVAATDEDDHLAPVSTTGAFVDIAAPGVNIPTTAMYGLYLGDSGTSLASAVVAGVAALMFSVNPALGPAEVTLLLEQTAVKLGEGPRSGNAGHGRVDAYAAVRAAAAYGADPSQAHVDAVSTGERDTLERR